MRKVILLICVIVFIGILGWKETPSNTLSVNKLPTQQPDQKERLWAKESEYGVLKYKAEEDLEIKCILANTSQIMVKIGNSDPYLVNTQASSVDGSVNSGFLNCSIVVPKDTMVVIIGKQPTPGTRFYVSGILK